MRTDDIELLGLLAKAANMLDERRCAISASEIRHIRERYQRFIEVERQMQSTGIPHARNVAQRSVWGFAESYLANHGIDFNEACKLGGHEISRLLEQKIRQPWLDKSGGQDVDLGTPTSVSVSPDLNDPPPGGPIFKFRDDFVAPADEPQGSLGTVISDPNGKASMMGEAHEMNDRFDDRFLTPLKIGLYGREYLEHERDKWIKRHGSEWRETYDQVSSERHERIHSRFVMDGRVVRATAFGVVDDGIV